MKVNSKEPFFMQPVAHFQHPVSKSRSGLSLHFPYLANQFYCQGAWLYRTTSGGYNYAWEFDDLPINGSFTGIGANSSALQFMIHSESQTGNDRVAVSDTIGICSLVSVPVFVTMDSLPATP